MRTTITVRGQTAVPSKIRKRFRLDAKSKIEWIVEDNIIKVVPIPKDPVKSFEGALKGKLDFKDFIKDREKERKEEAERR